MTQPTSQFVRQLQADVDYYCERGDADPRTEMLINALAEIERLNKIIAGLRNPSEAVLAAGWPYSPNINEAWKAMIDAALKEIP